MKLGIIQGRICPRDMKRLQVFPKSWEQELEMAREIGFGYIELLDDKEECFRSIMRKDKDKIFNQIKNKGLLCKSACLDILCNYSLLRETSLFLEKVDEFLSFLRNKKDFCLVIPFFDNNAITGNKELQKCLELLSQYDSILKKNDLFFALELDLPSNIIIEEFNRFNFTNIGICFDIGNQIDKEENIHQNVLALNKLIKHVHIKYKENKVNVQIPTHKRNLQQIFSAFNRINFTGMHICETNTLPDPIKAAKINFSVITKYIEHAGQE